MAENDPRPTRPKRPGTGDPATTPAPRVLPWMLPTPPAGSSSPPRSIGLLWAVGLGGYPALLFGALLSMPVAYFLLQPVRDRFTAALAARSESRRAAKEELRARLSGPATD